MRAIFILAALLLVLSGCGALAQSSNSTNATNSTNGGSSAGGAANGGGASVPAEPTTCRMSDWSEWTPCIDGMSHRFRSVLEHPENVHACAHTTETRPCTPVGCSVSEWSAFGACQENGLQTRTRHVLVAPQPGGEPCPALEESRRCDEPPTPTPEPEQPKKAPEAPKSPAQAAPAQTAAPKAPESPKAPAQAAPAQTTAPKAPEAPKAPAQAAPAQTAAPKAPEAPKAPAQAAPAQTAAPKAPETHQAPAQAAPAQTTQQPTQTPSPVAPSGCQVSEWSDWSDCNSEGKRRRVRVHVGGPPTGCPALEEIGECGGDGKKAACACPAQHLSCEQHPCCACKDTFEPPALSSNAKEPKYYISAALTPAVEPEQQQQQQLR